MSHDTGRDVRAVALGIVSTTILTAIFLLLPDLVPAAVLERLKLAYFDLTGEWIFGNPLSSLQFIGGPIGGFLTAYLTAGSLSHSVTNGVKAVVVAIVLLYCLTVGYLLVLSVVAWETFPVIQILAIPMIIGFPVAVISVFGGFVGAIAGYGLRAFQQASDGTG